MRTTLIGIGAFFFLAYPLVVLCSVVANLDKPRQQPTPAAITLTPRSAGDWLAGESGQPGRGELRRATIHNTGN